jgi:biotin transporter BioY
MYLVEGVLIDLPFFSSGNHGWKSLLGPTGGYLEGFVLAAWVVGYLVESQGWDRRLITACLAMIIGDLSIYLVGIPWLAHFVGWSDVWQMGFYPFLAGDALKIVIATVLLPLGWAVRAHHYNRAHSSTAPVRFHGVKLFLQDQFTIPELGAAIRSRYATVAALVNKIC